MSSLVIAMCIVILKNHSDDNMDIKTIGQRQVPYCVKLICQHYQNYYIIQCIIKKFDSGKTSNLWSTFSY
jgi:hypothetical protein